MLHALIDYGLFLAKTLTLVAAIVIALLALLRGIRAERQRHGHRDQIEVRHVNDHLREVADGLLDEMLDDVQHKRHLKKRRHEAKTRRRNRPEITARPRLFVLDFDGDLEASQTAALREEISAILQIAGSEDEVLVRLDSAGGLVHSYGLAASQLRRLRDRNLRLTVAVDKVAASGGYMMACVADQIIAAPFAVLGSIGVVAQLPNFHRWLKKNDIDVEMHTAGEFKRTLTMFGENSDSARSKFLAEMEDTHALFKSFVADNRPQVAIGQVATGEHWYGTRALTLKLVDQIKTSDDYLLDATREREVFEIRLRMHRSLRERLLSVFTQGLLGRAGRVGIDGFSAPLRNLP